MIRLGKEDFLLVTFDTLRYDVAQRAWNEGRIPNLQRWISPTGWEQRHTPGSFTLAAHAAFFAGFFPTPILPGKHPRWIGLAFSGSETLDSTSIVMDAPDIVTGFRQRGYHTICIGGVGFFNKQNRLGSAFPSLFDESHWSESLGVTEPESTRHQFELARDRILSCDVDRRLFVFVNLSALHQPNYFYRVGATTDSAETQLSALEYVDSQWPVLMDSLTSRGSGGGVLCSDHGTAYGEDGYWGHRLAHPVIWNVPYSEINWSRGVR